MDRHNGDMRGVSCVLKACAFIGNKQNENIQYCARARLRGENKTLNACRWEIVSVLPDQRLYYDNDELIIGTILLVDIIVFVVIIVTRRMRSRKFGVGPWADRLLLLLHTNAGNKHELRLSKSWYRWPLLHMRQIRFLPLRSVCDAVSNETP